MVQSKTGLYQTVENLPLFRKLSLLTAISQQKVLFTTDPMWLQHHINSEPISHPAKKKNENCNVIFLLFQYNLKP